MAERRLYIYVVDRDFGFAPNPFHGICTLATCKPRIRSSARTGDWIVGVGGARLKATGRCIFVMRVDEIIAFNDYWAAADYRIKRPARNGSSVMQVGDNIYHREGKQWFQANSHHSNSDGTVNSVNLINDTSVDRVLISRSFCYFGSAAPPLPKKLLERMGYKNGRGHRVFPIAVAEQELIDWLKVSYASRWNRILADPFEFDQSASRYTGKGSKIASP